MGMMQNRNHVDLLMPNHKNYARFIYFIPNFMQCVKTALNPMTMKLMYARQRQKNSANAALFKCVFLFSAHCLLFICPS